MRQVDYSYRIHNRQQEEDPELATIMYSYSGIDGPWYDMATCHPDYVDDIVGSLQWREEVFREERLKAEARLRKELEEEAQR